MPAGEQSVSAAAGTATSNRNMINHNCIIDLPPPSLGMPLHVYLGAGVGWHVRPAQACLLHHRQDIADPVGELCLVIDPAQHYPIQPHSGEVYESVDNLLRGADQEVTTPAGAT